LRVVHVMAGARVGGAEAFFERLIPALARAGLSQRAVIRHHGARARRIEAVGVPVTQLGFGRRFDFVTRGSLVREIAAFRPDLALAWMNRAANLFPVGAALHLARVGGYYDIKYYRGCDHLIANAPGVAEHLRRQGWPAGRLRHIPNFVADNRLPPLPRADAETPAGVPLLLALGRLHQVKGFDLLIRALALLPGTWLWLAGEGPERARLKRLAAELGVAERIRFLAWRDDIAALMAAADMVVVPSRREPLGNVVLEAWAQSRPVIAAAAEGPLGLISEHETGLLVPQEDHQALAMAIRTLGGAPALAAQLAVGGRSAYETAYTESAVVERYLRLFQSLTSVRAMGRGRSPGETSFARNL